MRKQAPPPRITYNRFSIIVPRTHITGVGDGGSKRAGVCVWNGCRVFGTHTHLGDEGSKEAGAEEEEEAAVELPRRPSLSLSLSAPKRKRKQQ